jgi:hypothetical protein
VNPHLEFFPEDAHGLNIYKFSQSMKWLKHLPPDLRVQMLQINHKHYYIFEPAVLRSGQMVVPIFFYRDNSEMYAKCAIPQVDYTRSLPKLSVTIPPDLTFDSASLVAVNAAELELTYPEIQVEENGLLSELCANKIIGESLINLDQTGKILIMTSFRKHQSTTQHRVAKSLEN